MGEPTWIVLDPGGENAKAKGSTGVAEFHLDGKFKDSQTLTGNEEVREYITRILWDAQGIICEDWKLRPESAKAFYWSDMPTSKLIGWLEGICYMRNIPWILQQPAVKPAGYKWWGKKPLPKSNILNHEYDAIAHGYYYLVKNGIRLPNG